MTRPAKPKAAPAERPRWLDYMPLDDLVADDRNPKAHDLPELRASLGRFGYTEPVVLDERTGKLVSGHGRRDLLLAERDAGNEVAEGVLVEDGVWLVPVVRGWRSKDDTEAGAYLIAANKLTERGGWLADPLASLLHELAANDGGLDGIGVSRTEVDDILAATAPPPDLDDLARDLGDPSPSDFWPVLRFKVPPPLRARYLALVANVDGGDAEQFEWLVAAAERATKQVKAKAS